MEGPTLAAPEHTAAVVPTADPPTPSASRRAAPRHMDAMAAMESEHGAVRAPKVLSPGAPGDGVAPARSSLQLDAPAAASIASPVADVLVASSLGGASMSPVPAASAAGSSSVSTGGAASPRAEPAAAAGPFALLHAVAAPRHLVSEPQPLWAGGAHARGFTAVNVPTIPRAPASNAGIGAVGPSTDPLLAHFAHGGGVTSLADEQFPGDVVVRPMGPDDVEGYRYPEFPAGGGITADMYQRLKREYARAGLLLVSKEAADARDVLPAAYSAPGSSTDADGVVHSRAKPYLKDPPLNDLPLESFDLRVIYERGRTGFEDDKEFPIAVGTVIAGRYKVTEFLGEAAFSRAVQAIDLKHNMHVCVKIIRNSKDFFDQSLDEVKLLHYINTGGDPDENCVVQLYDFFYFKEHMFLICELLRDNLYEFSKYNREHEAERYFTLPRLQSVTAQVLRALRFVHSLGLIHCDLKPENILIKSYSRCEVKVIDFGSSCFLTDNLTSYVQSRCYRAPEAILGCRYDGRIDIWSLGAIVAELATGSVLFANETVPGMLARIASIVGPFPPRMLREGRHSCRFFTKYGVLYEQFQPDAEEAAQPSRVGPDGKPLLISTLYFAQPTQLEHLVGFDDPDYVDFIRQCLTLDPTLRPTAEELLRHPFMTKSYHQ